MLTSCRPHLRGLAAVRYAVAVTAGWDWCDDHNRIRWNGAGSCHTLRLHPAPPEDRLAICGTCERHHDPMEWRDGCEPLELGQ